jgi:hypothetical protein
LGSVATLLARSSRTLQQLDTPATGCDDSAEVVPCPAVELAAG